MLKKALFEAAVLVTLLVGSWFGLSQLDLVPDKLGGDLSRDLQEKLGKAMHTELRRKNPPMNTPAVQKTLDTLVDTLAKGMQQPRPVCEVLDSDVVNAITLPGGTILIYRGLVEVMESPEELAAVVAHEMAHIEKDHVTKQLLGRFGLAVLVKAVTGDAMILGEISESLAATAFGRANEEEADATGRDLMLKAGIDPRAMAKAFRRMKEATDQLPSALQLLSTHPDMDDRIRASLEASVPAEFKAAPVVSNDAWKELKAAMDKDVDPEK